MQQGKIMQWNARGLKAHASELKQFLSSIKTQPDLICVAETLLKPTQKFNLESYEIIRKDREGTHAAGGVAILIKSGVQYTNLNLIFNKIEAIAIEMYSNNGKISVVNVYDPPDQSMDVEDYKQLFSMKGKVILTGDFNAHNPLWKSSQIDRRGQCIEKLLDEYGFVMLNTGQPTFQKTQGGTSVLDLSFASNSLANKCEWSVINSTLGSDHVPTFVDISENIDYNIDISKKWKLDKANWKKFQFLLDNTQNVHNDNIDIYNENITAHIISSAEQAIPVSGIKAKIALKTAPYWNEECSTAIYNRNKARNKYNKKNTLLNRIEYQRHKAIAQRTIRTAQTNSWQNYCSTLKNPIS